MKHIIKKTVAFASALLLCGAISVPNNTILTVKASSYINNSSLIPKYVSDSQVKLENGTPDWVKTLIMAEFRFHTATTEGTMAAAVKVLDHYQEMGVNGLWVTPINDPGPNGNGYSNLGPHTIDPALTGKTNYDEGWNEFKKFIDEAHKRNIRIIMDVVSWGTVKNSPLYEQNPSWYTGSTLYGGDGFNWKSEELKEWYVSTLVDIGLKTGLDGFRYDVEPFFAGYEVGKAIRDRLYNQGRKMLMMSEIENDRNDTYDLEQCGVTDAFINQYEQRPYMTFVDKFNLVDSIKNGENIGTLYSQQIGDGGGYRYYTHTISTHDFNNYAVLNRRIAIGYQAIYAPFIPMWYIGDEWDNSKTVNNVLFYNNIDWTLLEKKENRALFEDIKSMIKIRRENPDIFNYYPDIHRETNICKVPVAGLEDLEAYARYSDDTAMLIIPNNNTHNKNKAFTVYTPLKEMNLDQYRHYKVTDAETGELIVSGNVSKISKINVTVPWEDVRVLKIEATQKIVVKEPVSSETIIEQEESSESIESESVDSEEPEEIDEVSSDASSNTTDNSSSSSQAPVSGKESEFNFIIPGIIILLIAAAGAATIVFIKRKKIK